MAASRVMPDGEISVGLLVNAIKRGDFRATRELLKANPGLVRAKGPDGASAILLAVYCGHPEMVPLFVEYGAQLDFFESCAAGDRNRSLELLKADPSLLRQFSSDGYHGLGLAVFAEDLLARGADINAAAADLAAERGHHELAARLRR